MKKKKYILNCQLSVHDYYHEAWSWYIRQNWKVSLVWKEKKYIELSAFCAIAWFVTRKLNSIILKQNTASISIYIHRPIRTIDLELLNALYAR